MGKPQSPVNTRRLQRRLVAEQPLWRLGATLATAKTFGRDLRTSPVFINISDHHFIFWFLLHLLLCIFLYLPSKLLDFLKMHSFTSVQVLAFAGMASCMPSSSDPTLDAAMLEALKALGRSPSDYRLPGSLPQPNVKPGTDMLPGIDHIVWIMYENHSWDNIYGTLDRNDADGFTFNRTGQPVPDVVQKYANGSIQHLYKMPNNCQPTTNGPTQSWESTHEQMNNGSMDGWVTGGGEKPIAMGYWVANQLPFFHSLAKIFPISDTFFCSCPGQTWCNRMYLLAATSVGLVDTSQIIPGRTPPPAGNPAAGTIFNTLDTFNISWTNYVDGFGS
jgi:phospholipase C